MLERLDEIDWSKLSHAYGEATNVPEFVRGLIADDEDTREWAIDALWATICHQGSVYDSTAHAVPFLLELVASSEVQERARIIRLLGCIANSRPFDASPILRQAYGELFEELREASVFAVTASHAAVRKGIPLLSELLFSPERAIQQDAVTALFAFPEDSRQIVPPLLQLWSLTLSPIVRAACLFSLDKLEGLTPDIWEQLPTFAADEKEHPLLRFIAAVLLAKNLPEYCPPNAVELLRKVAGDWNGLNQIYADISCGAWPSHAARAALKVLDKE